MEYLMKHLLVAELEATNCNFAKQQRPLQLRLLGSESKRLNHFHVQKTKAVNLSD